MTPIQFLGEWVVRSSILILAGALLAWLLRVKNPSIRHTAWKVLLAGSLAIPILNLALPRVPFHLKRAPSAAILETAPSTEEARIPSTGIPDVIPALSPIRSIAATPIDWMRVASILYALAAGALLLRLFAGLLLSRRILRRSRPSGMLAGKSEVRESGDVASPVTAGVLRPAILLPLDWRAWDSATLDAVLAHERSHIRRHDPVVQSLSAIHCALLWANPLSWFLHRNIVRTAEEISDDDAIKAARDRAAYAEILLKFMQRGAGQGYSQVIPMARYDRPEKRIRRILNSTAIPRAVTRWSVIAILVLGAPLAYLVSAADPQSSPEPALPQFEVASIKPVEPNVPHMVGVHVYPGGRVVISALPLKNLIAIAFRLSYWQIAGGDAWAEKEVYDLEAKPSEAMRSQIKDLRYTNFDIESDVLRKMLQALLADRFQLKFHREMKTGNVYLLRRSEKPLALRPTEFASPVTDASEDRSRFSSIGYVDGKWSIFRTSMPQLAKFAADVILHVPVLDRTELTGPFDYRQRVPDLEPRYGGDQSPSFRSYLQEVGLKLESAKGSIESFVIDHAARPSPN